MFNWLKKKALEASQKEYNKGLQRNINFTRYVSKNWPKLEPKGLHIQDLLKEITKIEFKNSDLNSSGYSEENMKQLLDLDMKCRRLWGITLGESDLKYNKTFDPK